MKNLAQIYSRRAVIVILFGALFFVTLFGTYFLNKKYYGLMEDGLANNFFAPAQKMQAEGIATAINSQIDNIIDVLKTAAEYSRFQNITSECLPEQKLAVGTIKTALGDVVDHASLVDENGTIICNTNEKLEGLSVANYPNVQEALSSHKTVVSHAMINPLGQRIVSAIVPIFSPQEDYLGFVGAAVDIEHFEKLLIQDSKFTPSSYVVLVDDDGTVLYHPDKSLIMENVFGEKIQKAIGGNSGFNNMLKKIILGKAGYDFYIYNNEAKVGGYAPVKIVNGNRFWSVVVASEAKEYQNFTEQFFIKNQLVDLALIFGAFLLIVIAVYFLGICETQEDKKAKQERYKQ